MAATPTPAALTAAEDALAFLEALGKDPAQTYFRTLQQGTQPNRRRRGRDLLGFNLEALVRDNASQSIYVVVGNATGATGTDRKTGRPTGAVIDEDCPTVSAVFVEWDNKPIDWQRNACKELGLPEPSLMVATGGKSVHCYWVLREPMPAAEWRQLQTRLIEHCDSDRSCKNPSRVMRLPGFAYIDKATGKPTDNRAEIIHNSGARYSVRELEQCIPAGTATPAPLPLLQAPRPAPMVSGAPVPFRDFITKAAAELIETGSREGSCNDDGLALSMELVAVEAWLQAQGAQADETAHDAYACYLSHCPDTINGAPFDTRAAWARFEGAAARQPTTGTPEDKLLQRLGFHRRKAAQPASNVIPFSGTRNAQVDEMFRDESATAAASAEESPDPATLAQRKLREAVADGIGSADMEALLASLAQRTKLHPLALRKMAEALQAEGQGAERIAAEAERLQKRIDQQQAGQALTLDYLLPAPIAQALELRTRYLPADAPAVACLFLSSVASLQKIGSRITGNPASGFTVPLNLWTAIIAASGQKKSPLLRRVVLDPTAEIRQTMAEGNRRDLQEWTQQCREASKGQKPDAPQPLRLHVGDVTGEALAAQLVTLAERRRGLLVLRDELSALFAGLNQYKGGGGNDGQFLLELFDGEGHTSLRISGTREFPDSLVSIAGCMQPAVLAQLVNASTSDADGRYARFLFAPLTQQPKRLPCPTPEEQAAIDRAGADLQRILGEIHREPARQLHLGPDAMELFADYEHRQALAAAAATIPAQGAVLGKSAGKVLRVAGLLHRLDGIANGTKGTTVGADPLLRAIDLVEHLNGLVLGLHADLNAGSEPTGLMRKIHDTARSVKKPFQWRQLRDRLGKRQAEEWGRDSFEAAIEALRALGVGRIESPDRGGLAYVPTGDLP
ncbi:DUF3987 domain-containing protein [Cyanobium gracile]|uniref:DUF3987 domain-containing protein n=1 Tax=Cyanobium gracile UHCC 0281 TaxID=3110309 RepID=A0ABU5SXU1_9CYAN|nr:DUF3987 domain-containing protein [Cyanobium gracile]MEA5443340.1 DUF3987 domain-containing protein [Cyanobium gracile UHCC 0281]